MRKLATAAISFSAAVFAANYIVPFEWLIIPAIIIAAVGATLFIASKNTLRLTAAALIFFAMGLVCFYLHSNATTQRAAQFDGQLCYVKTKILTYPEIHDDYCRFEVQLENYDLPNLKAYLYDNDLQLIGAVPGDYVSLQAKVSAADTLYGEEYSGYHAKGIYLKLSSKGESRIEKGSFDIFTLPQHISHWLSSRIEKIFPSDTEVFMRSLMLGDKTDFYGEEEIYVPMTRAGLMHIVAVSGMHISYLVSLLYHVFGKGRRSALICIGLVWLFAFVTGAGPSVVRASFMCSTLLMAPVLRRENDPITSLSAVLALILCINPHAATSISLQLSFAAMAGLVCISGKIYKALSAKLHGLTRHKPVRDILVSISNSIGVMAFTIPLTAVHFGTVPLLAPLTNLASLWAVSYCFCGGWLSCALSIIPFAGEISAWIVSWFARYIIFVAELISNVPFAVLYAETRGTWLWMAISYALVFTFAMVKKSLLGAIVFPGIVSALLLAALLLVNERYYEERQYVSVLDVGQGQCITVLTDEVTAVLDCGNIYSVDDAGTIAASHLYSRGRESLDFLLLSHLHADHADGAAILTEMIDIDRLILPAEHDNSDDLYAGIIDCAERNSTEVLYIAEDSQLECGDVKMSIYKAGFGEDENERCLMVKLDVEDSTLLVLADATEQMQRRLALEQDLSDVDAIVVSHHGSKYSLCEELLEEVGGGYAFISVGHNYYGHPATETLEALERWDYNIYRTDEVGNIDIRIGK